MVGGVSLTWPGKPRPSLSFYSNMAFRVHNPTFPWERRPESRESRRAHLLLHPPKHWLLLSHHLGVSSKCWVKWGWLAEETAKFEKRNPEMQLTADK